ncbi:MAG: GGDEF domain-containing protein [Rhodanobacteraceae bacterium]|nr:GGDEF domain-containing protein [Rhodanobacteraceae bacterium]
MLLLNREMLTLAQGNPRREANALTNIGIVERRMGNLDAAQQAFERASARRRRGGTADSSSTGECQDRRRALMQEAQLRRRGGGAGRCCALPDGAPARACNWRPRPASRARQRPLRPAAGELDAARQAMAEAKELARGIPDAQSECTLGEAAAALRESLPARALHLAAAERQSLAGNRDVAQWLQATTIEAEALLALQRQVEALTLIDQGLDTAARAVRTRERTPLLRLRADALHQLGRDREAYPTRIEYEAAEQQARGAGTTEQMASFLQERAREREEARAQDEAQRRQIAEIAAQSARERALAAGLIAFLAIALAALLWLRARDLRQRQQALVAEHHALSEAHEQLEQESEALLIEATTDQLTGACSRRAILEHLQQALASAIRRQRGAVRSRPLQRINDEYGHPVGDAALRHACASLRAETGAHGRLGRYGGEEFLLVLPGLDRKAAAALGERCLQRLADSPLALETGVLRITSSAGCAGARSARTRRADARAGALQPSLRDAIACG